ncbi:MAG: phospholipase D-like domain-containing protein [Egibacteraceae bacterium]
MTTHRVRNLLLTAGSSLVGFYAFEAAKYKRVAAKGFDLVDPPAPGTSVFGRLCEALTEAPVRQGNRIQILRNGCEIFPAMLDAIASAQTSVFFETYLYWTGDVIGPQLAHALADKASAGREVNVLLDATGAARIDRCLVGQIERAGGRVVWFRPPRWYTLDKLNNRTHRRLLVVDGHIGFTGGVGIADEWTGNCEDPQHWRETHVRVEGPVVRDLSGAFFEHWSEAANCILTNLPKIGNFEDGVCAHVTRSSAAKDATDLEKLFYAAIAGSRERLWLTTGYFAPRQAFVDALIAAVSRAVDVRILVNGPHNHREVARQAGQTCFAQLLKAGVRIFEYQKTFLHAKTLVIDDSWATVGTNNFNNRSFALNDEITLSTWDKSIAAELADHFLDDLDASIELDLEGWSKRPLAKRLVERATALIKREL